MHEGADTRTFTYVIACMLCANALFGMSGSTAKFRGALPSDNPSWSLFPHRKENPGRQQTKSSGHQAASMEGKEKSKTKSI